MTDPKTRLAELVAEVRDTIVTNAAENLDNGRECAVCGVDEIQVVEGESETRIEYYVTECPHSRCDGTLSFSRVVVRAGDSIPVDATEFLNDSCTQCEKEHLALLDLIQEIEPVEVDDFDIPVAQIVSTQLHTHHTSYVPEKTIAVCNSCHSNIHHDDSFRPDLTPELSRSEVSLDD